jgi:hypothetical protein
MLTFTALGKGALRISGGNKPLVVFPGSRAEVSDKDPIVILATPEEEPTAGTISWPGEYNEAGVSMRGIGHVDGQQVSYLAEVDGTRALFLSAPLQDWTDLQIQAVGDVDILVLPTGELKLVQKLVDEFDPRVLFYVPNGEGDEGSILKAIGAQGEHVSEYKLKGSFPAEGREVVVLTK